MPENPTEHPIEYYEKKYGAEPVQVAGRITIPYKWHVGRIASHFFKQLRDEQKIFGLRCDGCAKVLLPPRENCPFCSRKTTEWVEVSSCGMVTTFTIVRELDPALARLPLPYAVALIKLDGADTALCHLVTNLDVAIGDRVQAVFATHRKGHVLDIEYFRKVGS